jgi:hypothetical protein
MKAHTSRFLFAFLVTGLVLVPVAKSFAQEAPQATEAAEAAVEAATGEAAAAAEAATEAVTGEAAAAAEAATEAVTGEAAAAAEAAAEAPAGVIAPTAYSFSRHADPVVLKGEQVPKFEGAREETIRVFANKKGKLQAIPYQMDERNQWGEFVVVKGKRVIPDKDDGDFDENDEIVFLTRDIGMKTSKDQWPTGYKEAYEVEVTDPLTSDKGYAYVMMYASASAAPAPSTDDYISVEEKGEWGVVHATNYELGFVKWRSGLDYDVLTVMPAAGGSGVDWFDMLKVRVMQNIKRYFLFGLTTRLDRTEKNFLVKVYGYKDGPVRVVRVMKVNVQIIWKLPAPGATVNSVFYPEWIEWPVPINLPFKPSMAFYDIELDVSHDYDFKVSDQVKVYSSHTNRWDLVDGKMTPPESETNKEKVAGAYYGFDATAAGHGAGFYTVRPPKSFSTTLVGLYKDDATNGMEPEYYKGDGDEKKKDRDWVEGALPLAGGRFIDWDDVGKGIHTVFWYHLYPPFWKNPGDEKPFLDIIDHPVSVTVN